MTKPKRMKPERLAEYETQCAPEWRQQPRYRIMRVFVQALKAEREYAERTCEWWREWDEDGSHWETSCGADDLQRGTYCSCCGGLIVETNDD